MSILYVVTADHPDCSKPAIHDITHKRQRLSTLYKQYAPAGEDIVTLHNGVEVDSGDLRKVRTKAGDKILFVPRVGFFAALWGIGVWIFANVAIPIALSYGISYLGGELFGQDLPESKDGGGGQSFSFNPRSRQLEGGAYEKEFGENQHHGTVIAKWTDVDATGETAEIMYLLVCFGEDPAEGVVSSQVFLNDRPITDYSGVTWTERKGTFNQTVITGFEKTKLETRIAERVTNSAGALTVTLPRDGFDDVEYTLEFAHGIWAQRKSGDLVASIHGVKVEIAEVGGGWTTLLDTDIAGYQRAPVYKAYSADTQGFSADRTKQYKLRVTKTNADDATRRADYVGLRSVRGVVDIAFTHPGKPLIGIKALATAGLSGDIDVKCIRKGKIVRTYNGAWTWEYSHNRAWTTYAQLTQPVITGDGGGTAWGVDSYEGFDPSQLDTAFFYEWAQICDDLVDDGDSGTEELMPFDHIFDRKVELWQSAYEVAQIGRAHLIWQGTKLSGWIDKAWGGTSDLITDENIVAGSWRQEWTKQRTLAGDVKVWFQEASGGYKRIGWPEHNANAGRHQSAISVEGIGIKTRGGASRIAKFALARNEKIREVDQFQMRKDALRYKPGDVHPIQQSRPNWGKAYRVRRYVNSNTLELDRTVVAEAGDSLYVRAYNPSTELVVTTEYTVDSIRGSKVKITATFAIQPIFDDIVAIGSTSQIKQRRILKIEWTGEHYFNVTVETYDSTLWATDSDTPVMPYAGAAPVSVRNALDRFVTWGEVRDLIEQSIPAALDTDKPEMSNITWEDNQPGGGSVRWSATDAGEDLEIRYRGTSYAITAGNTANRFVYWVVANSTFSNTNSEATMRTQLEAGVWMVCENKSGTAYPVTPFQILWAGLLQAGTITATLAIIGDAAIDTAQLAALAVEEAKINTGAVTVNKIGALAVEEAKINTGAVTVAKIGAGAVEEAKIAALAVSEGKLAALSVSTAKIQALAVTAAEIGALAVTQAKIGLLAVETANIKDLNVETIKIANSATHISSSGSDAGHSTSAAAWTDVLSVAITSVGGTVNILAQALMSNLDVGVDQRVRVYNSSNATTIFEQEYSPNAPTLFMSQGCLEIPGSGSRTYKIQMKSNGSSSFTLASVVISLTESKGK